MFELVTSEAVVQFLWTAAMVLAFAGIGAVRTYHSARAKGEQWEWGKGKAEIVALGGAGALAGIYVFSVGASPTDPVFGTAVTVAALMARKAYLIHQESTEHYEELTDAGVDPLDAAVLAIKEGIERNDADEIREGLETLLEQGGRPSKAKAEQNVAETREQVEQGDLESLVLEPEAILQVDDDSEADAVETEGEEPDAESAAEASGEEREFPPA